MRLNTLLATVILVATSSTSPAWAGEGHDHGEAPATQAGATLPRFVAESDLFELVGVLDGRHLSLWLDRAADNSPVRNAKLELELGGVKVPVTAHGEGEFEATLAQPLAPGEIAVAATVMAGEETDLLAGDLDIHAETEMAEDDHARGWREVVLWVAVAGATLAGLAWLIRRLRNPRRGVAA